MSKLLNTVELLPIVSIILFVVGITSDSTLINIKDSNNSSFIVLLSLVFIIFNFENARSQFTCVQDRVRIYLYAKYKFVNDDVCKLYLYKNSNKCEGQL